MLLPDFILELHDEDGLVSSHGDLVPVQARPVLYFAALGEREFVDFVRVEVDVVDFALLVVHAEDDAVVEDEQVVAVFELGLLLELEVHVVVLGLALIAREDQPVEDCVIGALALDGLHLPGEEGASGHAEEPRLVVVSQVDELQSHRALPHLHP